MKNILLALLSLVILSCNPDQKSEGLSFLRTSGHDIVNEKGEKIYLRGVGLGNWMLPEGYMWKFGPEGDRPRKIEKIVESCVGKEKSDKFWKEFRKNYITEVDIKRIKELGFNSVRPALNSRLFVTEGQNPVFIEEGFQLLDSLVKWCNAYQVYIIIDVHGAPGGQTGANIDDSPNDQPELFIHPKNQDLLVELWSKIAQKYKDQPVVAAYNLINEPLPGVTGAADKYKHLLIPLYERLIKEIRKIDQKHMITVEGYDWANNWSFFSKPLDGNIFYQFHYYCWDRPDNLKSIDYYLKKRDTLNTPIWVGETGEKGNTIYWGTAQYFEANNVGLSFWPWKKMDTKNTPYSIRKPDNWDIIAAYTHGGPKPDSVVAGKAFDQLLENIKLSNCDYFEDVVHSIFNRIPAKIEAENYGHFGYKHSYFVMDTAAKSKYYRITEPVQVKLFEVQENENLSEQYVELQKDEWIKFNFNSMDTSEYQAVIKLSVQSPSVLKISFNGKIVELTASNPDWMEIPVAQFNPQIGANEIQLFAGDKVTKIDWLKITRKELSQV